MLYYESMMLSEAMVLRFMMGVVTLFTITLAEFFYKETLLILQGTGCDSIHRSWERFSCFFWKPPIAWYVSPAAFISQACDLCQRSLFRPYLSVKYY